MTKLRTNLHFRKHDRMAQILPKGGATLAIELDGKQITIGIAQCSRKDLFCRAQGRIKANGRLDGALAVKDGESRKDKNILYFVLPDETDLKKFIIEQPAIKAMRSKLLAGG